MTAFRILLMMHKHQKTDTIKLSPKKLEFDYKEDSKDLSVESNTEWSISVNK